MPLIYTGPLQKNRAITEKKGPLQKTGPLQKNRAITEKTGPLQEKQGYYRKYVIFNK